MKRDTALDFIRGFCMILVIFGHVFDFKENPLIIYIYSFHVPAFFIVSGILIERCKEYEKPFGITLWKSFSRLIVPYFFFEILCNLTYCCLHGFTNLRWLMTDTLLFYTVQRATWFLPVLFIAKNVLIGLHKLSPKKFLLHTVAILSFSVALLSGQNIYTLPWYLHIVFRCLCAIGFIWIGMLIAPHLELISKNNMLVVSILIVSLLAAFINGKISTYAMRYSNPLLYAIGGLSGTLVWYSFAHYFSKFSIFSFFSKNSVIVLGTHQAVLMILENIFGEAVVLKFAIPFFVVILLIEYPISYLINRYVPFMLGQSYTHQSNSSAEM